MDWTYALKTALLPDAKTKAAQAAARDKLKKLEEQQDKKESEREASRNKQRKPQGADEAASPRFSGAAASAPSADAPWGVGEFFAGLFGGGGGQDEAAAPAAAAPRCSEAGKMSKAEMKSSRAVLGQGQQHINKSHKHEAGDNSTRDTPPRPLRWRPRVRTGAGPECPAPAKLPAPDSSGAGSSTTPPPSPPSETVPILDSDGNTVELFVDGPYGSASEEVFGFEVLVLVGAGIGVTPFASILKTLAIQAKQDRLETPLKKVAFYWVCRDDREFETFRDLLVGIVDDRALANIFELNTYITGEIDLKKSRDSKAYSYNQFAGRPDWNRIGGALRKSFPESDVGVFLCGPNAIGQQLVSMCKKFNPPKPKGPRNARGPRPARFVFHKETF